VLRVVVGGGATTRSVVIAFTRLGAIGEQKGRSRNESKGFNKKTFGWRYKGGKKTVTGTGGQMVRAGHCKAESQAETDYCF